MDERERQFLKVQMETVKVELCSSHGAQVRGEVFLRPPQIGAERGDRVVDMLAQRSFIPVKTAEKLLFVATRNIAWVRLDLLSAIDELDPEAEDDVNSKTVRVVIELIDGEKLEGELRYFAPLNVHRFGDYLEQLPPFLALRTADWLYLVSSLAVSSFTPLEEKR